MLTSVLVLLSSLRSADGHDAANRKIYTVATAHLDTNWLWTIQDTIENHIPKTLDDNFALFEKYPDYVFNFEGAFRYLLAKEYYPERFAKLKKYIASGRWHVTGSWLTACDANMPSPESLIRHCLYGNEVFMREFGKRSYDIFLPDCFGFPYSLPTIAKHCGLLGFSTQKLSWGSAAGIPFPVGRWQGIDGSSIIAALDPGSYGSTLPANLDDDPKVNAQIDTVGDASGAYVTYRYHGTGDTGGAPSDTSVRNLEANIKHPGRSTAISASGDQLYRDITPAEMAKLPSYDGELLLTTHGTGCYTSQAAMKKWNRENENLAGTAESAAVLADLLGGASYPTKTLTDAWTRFLWHQFHDDLTGTSIPNVYPFSWNDEILSLNNFAEVAKNSLGVVAAATDTSGPGIPLVVYNPVSAGRVDAVEADVRVPEGWRGIRVLDAANTQVPSQVDSRRDGIARIVFTAKAPSLGVAVFHVVQAPADDAKDPSLTVTSDGLESRDYRIKLDRDGNVSSIFDKSIQKELLSAPIALELRDDPSTNWPSWEVQYNTVRSAPRSIVGGTPRIKVLEEGPARVGLEIERVTDGSTFTQRIYLAPGTGRIDFPTHVSWHCRGTLLKADFPFASASSDATYDLGFGAVERGVDTEKKYEVPGQKWADQSEPDGGFGCSILTDCKYGWDKPDEGHLRLTLLHTARPGRGYQFQGTNDLGEHDFTYSLYSHSGDWRNGTWKEAADLNQPLVVLQTVPHAGALGDGYSLVDPQTSNLQVSAVKMSDSGHRMIVRVVEKDGRPAHAAKLVFGANIRSVEEVDGQEDPIKGATDIHVRNRELSFDLHRFQPRAFAVTLSARPIIRPIRSTAIGLPFDASLVAPAGMPLPGSLEWAIPSDLWPKSIDREGIHYDLGSSSSNAVTCDGQTLHLPAGTNRVELLATTLGADATVQFQVGDTAVDATVPSMNERIGQWTNRVVDGKVETVQSHFAPAYMKRTPVAWNSTHRIRRDGAIEPYMYCLVFKVSLRVPKGVEAITLPKNQRVKVLAATAVADPKPEAMLAELLYR